MANKAVEKPLFQHLAPAIRLYQHRAIDLAMRPTAWRATNPERCDHDDLHARVEQGWARGGEPAGSVSLQRVRSAAGKEFPQSLFRVLDWSVHSRQESARGGYR